MSIPWGTRVARENVLCTARVKAFPGGKVEVLVADRPIFGGKGWEPSHQAAKRRPRAQRGGHDTARAVRRARAQVRDIALSTPFRWFVTLTLNQEKVDRYDMAAITRRLNTWLDNQVRRRGLSYVLVPERHKDGAVHFHGFFNDALEAVDSGTVSLPGQKAPRRPRTARQRAEWLERGGRPVYNLPGWSWGFTTAIELYGEYEAAVGYVCKYIGKDMGASPNGDGLEPQRIGGRWYYSGGQLGRPEVTYANLDIREAMEEPGAYRFDLPQAGLSFVQFSVKGGEFCGKVCGKVPGGRDLGQAPVGMPLPDGVPQDGLLGLLPGAVRPDRQAGPQRPQAGPGAGNRTNVRLPAPNPGPLSPAAMGGQSAV